MKFLLLLTLISSQAFAKATITIKEKDGKVYFQDTQASRVAANAWIAEEKTRPYWKPDFVVNIVDNDLQELAEQIANETEFKRQKDAADKIVNDRKARLKSFDMSKIKDPDVRAILQDLVDGQ